jgi:hypothetical protein
MGGEIDGRVAGGGGGGGIFLALLLWAHPENRTPKARVAVRWSGRFAPACKFLGRFKLFKLQFRRDRTTPDAQETN